MKQAIRLLLLMSILTSAMFAQGIIKGKVTDSGTKQPIPSVNISIVGTNIGTVTNENGEFSLNIDNGSYKIKASAIGYTALQKQVTVENGEVNIDFAISESAIQVGEVVVEVNRAKERETPVAFSNVGSKSINKQIHSQDAPLLVKNIPGVYSYSTDGVGNGESKMYIRGFDQNRVQVLINGIPTNDPESNAVYWSNWGAVSSAAASIQVQRGAGSSLYGSGSFGGSFNVVTQEVGSKFGAEAHASFGTPELGLYGFSLQSGLLADNFVAGAITYDWKTGRGNREGSYYQGANYYAVVATYPDASSSLKVVLHGGPQEHGYSYNAPIAYFKKYGYTANPAYFLPIDVLKQMVGTKTLEDSLQLKGDSRLLRDSKYLTLSHNFYQKPQLELHLTKDINESNSVHGTFFYSVGRGGGSSINGASSLSSATTGADTSNNWRNSQTTYPTAYANLGSNGVINSDAAAANYIAKRFLASAYQRISYSLHRQWGFIGSWDTKLSDELKITTGGEYRDWFADHPGYYTNLFGKSSIAVQGYGYRVNGVVRSSTFTRKTYQGDMDFGGSDKVDVNYYNPFMGYSLTDANGTYNNQYRNYVGETKQGTLFLQANYKVIPELTLLGSMQYAFYNYHIYENMPSESAIADSVGAPANAVEGLNPDGLFYMKSSATTPTWYRFKLVDATRSRGFFQPKIGANYNFTNEINFFGNYSHVERMVDLSVFYNSGNPNPNANDEKSNQIEIGTGYKNEFLNARLNLYQMSWENKTASITDVSKAGLPGYDRNGNRYELIGSSKNQGIEIEATFKLDDLLPISGISLNGSFTAMDNKWTKVLDEVKTDPTKGALQEDANLNGKLDAGEDKNGNATLNENRRVFDSGALDKDGIVNALYYTELENTVNASTPFTTLTYGVTYETDLWFIGLNAITAMNYYAYDGGSYIAVDGAFDNTTPVAKFNVTKYDNKLPRGTVFDVQGGVNLTIDPVRLRVTAQVLNLFDTEFLTSANRSGVLPGITRSFRLNVAAGI